MTLFIAKVASASLGGDELIGSSCSCVPVSVSDHKEKVHRHSLFLNAKSFGGERAGMITSPGGGKGKMEVKISRR